MRPRHVLIPLALALAARVVVRYVKQRRGAQRRPVPRDDFAPDPRDPVQGLDEASELQVMPLAVDAVSRIDVEAAEDLAGLEAELDEIAVRDDLAVREELAADRLSVVDLGVVEDVEFDEPTRPRDAGDLYGAHTPAASDREHPDDDRAFADGQNWIEALETSAVENGAEPERSLDDIIDDEDVLAPPHPSTTRRDIPIADLGAGGRRGL
jgi:hypothetical protein